MFVRLSRDMKSVFPLHLSQSTLIKIEDASPLYAAQRFARRLNATREAARHDGADHERITALLRSIWEGRRWALRGGREAGLLLDMSSTQLVFDSVALQKQPTEAALRRGSTSGLLLTGYFKGIDMECRPRKPAVAGSSLTHAT
jgi:hypothetical protein